MKGILIILIALITFCSFSYAQDTARIGIPLIIHDSTNPEGVFNSRVMFIADQLLRNKSQLIDKPIIITAFQNLENLNEINPLGRLIAESLIHEMQVRNLKVIDFWVTERLKMTESGEITLSRDPKKIREVFKGVYILSGTYSLMRNGYFINVRIIDMQSSEIVSTAQTLMPLDLFQELSKPIKPIPSIKIIGVSK